MALSEKTEPINGVAHSPGEACADWRGAYAASFWRCRHGSLVQRLVAVGRRSSSSIAARVLLSAYRGGPKLKESFQMLEASIPRFCRP